VWLIVSILAKKSGIWWLEMTDIDWLIDLIVTY